MNYLISILFCSFLLGQSLDERYHTLSEIYSYLDSLNQINEISDLYHLDTIGFSTQETNFVSQKWFNHLLTGYISDGDPTNLTYMFLPDDVLENLQL